MRDEYSRYVLEARSLANAKTETVQACFEALFVQHGLPAAIRSDNGVPFASMHAPLGLSRLSAWWVALGINLLRGRPARPGDNSHHERLHLDLSNEVEGADYAERQAALDIWRQEFNEIRPHESLGMQRPADVYRPSPRPWEGTPEQIDYEGLMTRRVRRCGQIGFLDHAYSISRALVGWDVGLKPVEDGVLEVYLLRQTLGRTLGSQNPQLPSHGRRPQSTPSCGLNIIPPSAPAAACAPETRPARLRLAGQRPLRSGCGGCCHPSSAQR